VKNFLKLFSLLISLPLLAQSSGQWDFNNPREYTIGGITVSGIQFLNPGTIIAITGLKEGDPITIPGDKLTKAIQRIWDQGLVGDASVSISRIEGNLIYLDFMLKERPRLSKFVFVKGVKKGEQEDLLEKIDQARGSVVNDAMIKNTQKKIKNFYLEKGFLNTEVKVVQAKDTILPNNIFLRIEVDRKEKVKIQDIDFEGLTAFEEKKLKRKMKKTKEKRVYKFFVTSKFNRKLYEADKEKISEFFFANGYRDFKIAKDTVYAVRKDRVSIKMTLDEGNKYYFRNIFWRGNFIYPTRTLDSILSIKKGAVYSTDLLQRRLSFNPNGVDISSLYLDNGYLFFSVDPVEIHVDGDSIDIEMRIYEGAQAVIENVTVSGNTKTHDHVVLRELYTKPGDIFSRSNLIRSQRELSVLGYFDPEKIEINPVPNPAKGTVDIHYRVEEKPSDQIQLSGGWGGGSNRRNGNFVAPSAGFIGTLGLVFNNFSLRNISNTKTWDPLPSGDGQRLSVNFQSNGRSYQNYQLSFMEPWFGGKKPVSYSFSVNHSRLNYFNPATQDFDQHLDITNISTGLGRRLKVPDDHFTLNNSISYSLYHYRNYTRFNVIGIDTGYSNNISLVTSLARNSLDELNFPTSGSSLNLTVSLTPPFSLFNNLNYADPNLSPRDRYRFVEYHKWMLDMDWYSPLVSGKKRKLVLRSKANFGVIGSYKRSTGIGPFERFMVGGNGMFGVFGFIGTDLIGLRGYQNTFLPFGKFSNVGGTVYNKFAMELRYPVATSAALSLTVLSFFEAANTWDENSKFNPFDLYRSAGIGARIFMPAFGLIGLDYGWPMDVPLNQPSWKPYQGAFTFTIGQTLR
jgi:outer membrane protein insertion porin family